MYDGLTKHQVGLLIADPAINNEFSKKTQILNTRLRRNNLDYKNWETMTDRQQNIFSNDLFLDGGCATSIDDYVTGAADSCDCPDVVEDLHHHSPALMQGIENFQNAPQHAHHMQQSEALDKTIDSVLGNILSEVTKKKKVKPAQIYEQKVLDSMGAANILGSIKIADADDNGPDAEFILPDGRAFWLEVKLNSKAQMGESAVRYYPARPENRFELANEKGFDEEAQRITFAALDRKEKDIMNWVTALIDPADPRSSKWLGNPNKTALGFQTTYRKFIEAQEKGLQNKASAGFGKLPPIKAPTSLIKNIYATKSTPTYYIQIGGKGLYYLKENPAELPVPPFDGEIQIEMRPRASGKDKVFVKDPATGRDAINPETGKRIASVDSEGNTVYKYRPSAVEGDDDIQWQNGSYSVVARFVSEDLVASDYTLDDPESIMNMLATLSTEEPELEIEPSPEESEDS